MFEILRKKGTRRTPERDKIHTWLVRSDEPIEDVMWHCREEFGQLPTESTWRRETRSTGSRYHDAAYYFAGFCQLSATEPEIYEFSIFVPNSD